MDDYYEPWTYKYEDLFNAPEGADQPTARPISMVTGKPIDVKAGPNWDDDLSGSPVYAANDPNLEALTPEATRGAVRNRTSGVLLSSAHLQSLSERLLRSCVSLRRNLQTW